MGHTHTFLLNFSHLDSNIVFSKVIKLMQLLSYFHRLMSNTLSTTLVCVANVPFLKYSVKLRITITFFKMCNSTNFALKMCYSFSRYEAVKMIL